MTQNLGELLQKMMEKDKARPPSAMWSGPSRVERIQIFCGLFPQVNIKVAKEFIEEQKQEHTSALEYGRWLGEVIRTFPLL